MTSVLAWSMVDRGFDHRSSQTKAMEMVCVASRLSTQQGLVDLIGMIVLCQSKADC
jgi:hypothetical protein